jgi:hypothetical protein
VASGRGELTFPVRAGLETAEWAHDRADVRAAVRHRRAPIAFSWRPARETFEGHRYEAVFTLPGRFNIDAIRVRRPPEGPAFSVTQIVLVDAARGLSRLVSPVSAYLSDESEFREAASTPVVRLFERPRNRGRAWVVARLRSLPGPDEVLQRLHALVTAGIDPYDEALVTVEDAPEAMPADGHAERSETLRAAPGRVDLRAAGPGWLVLAESWDRGWSAAVNGRPEAIVRVNHGVMAVHLPAGTHLVSFRYAPPGLLAGTATALLALVALAVWARPRGPRS